MWAEIVVGTTGLDIKGSALDACLWKSPFPPAWCWTQICTLSLSQISTILISCFPDPGQPSCCSPLRLAGSPPNRVEGCHLQAILPPSPRLRPLLFPIPRRHLRPHCHPPPRLNRPHRSWPQGRLRVCREGPGEGGQGGSRCQSSHLLLRGDERLRNGALGGADGPSC